MNNTPKSSTAPLLTMRNTIYTPTSPFTYGNWTGLLSITLDPNGFGSYLIGEGLNGGYTVGEFLAAIASWFKTGIISRADASFTIPPKAQYTLGEKIIYSITYKFYSVIGFLFQWVENVVLDTREAGVGTITLKPRYGTTTPVGVGVKNGPTLGQAPNDLDPLIIQVAKEVSTASFALPADLLKAVLNKESRLRYKAYRYEPCYDRKYISGLNRLIKNKYILQEQPHKHYRMATNNPDLDPQLSEGDQVNSITVNDKLVSAKDFYTSYSSIPLEIKDINGDGKITAFDIWKANDAKQNYSKHACTMTETDGNFTPQFLIAASYGLGQVMYPTAMLGIDPNATGPADNIGKLIDFYPTIKKSGERLKVAYDAAIGTPGLCQVGGKWWDTLLNYNGGGDPAYPKNICNWYNNGLYKVTQ